MNAWFRFTFVALLFVCAGAAQVSGAALDAKTKAEITELHKKAVAGDAASQFLLGAYFDTGTKGLPVTPDQAEYWYRKSADQGYAMGQNALGSLYNSEKLGPPDYGQAIQWFRAAAEQGLPLAEYNLGYMYYAARGARQDHREALKWIGRSASKGFAIAQFTVGKMLDSGAGLVNKNQAEAFRWLKLAANQDHGQSQYKLGVMLFQGHGAPQDFVEACKWMRLAVNQNVPRAKEALNEMLPLLDAQQAVDAVNRASQFQLRSATDSRAPEPDLDTLAPMLASGRRPVEQATIPHMTPGARRPSAPSVPSVAEIPAVSRPASPPPATGLPTMPRTTASGTATPAPTTTAAPAAATKAASTPQTSAPPRTPERMAMASTAASTPAPPVAAGSLPPVSEYAPVELVRLKYKAEQGDSESRFQLGRVFARGDRVNQNFGEALKWHTLAAQQGHAGAQAALGTMHYWGRGAAQDYARAAQWLLLSAEQGNSTAQFWLGMIYERGDPKERLKWFREAAEHGSTLGQTHVAGLYLSGAGGEVDPIEAYKWLELAANKGSKNAGDMRATLADLLSAKEIEAAKARAMQFIPKRRMAPLNR